MSAPAQAMAPASSDWTTEEGQWVLLVCIPHVVSDTVLPPGTDLSVEREHPPQAFCLTVPRRVAPDPKSIYNHPYVSSVGDFGRFVLYATHSTQNQPEPPVIDDFDTDAEPEAPLDKDFPKELFLYDLNTRTATHLPHPERRPIISPGSVGLLATSATNSIIIVHLRPFRGTNVATLLCYTSDDNRWTDQNLYYRPGAPGQREWRGGDGVIKYMGLMLWVDLACGILALDTNLLLQGRPELQYVPLPQECQIQGAGLARERCVGVSAGMIRFLEISNYERVRLWTLVDIATGGWTLDHQLDLQNLRDEDGFKAMDLELPNECPAVAFIHPEHPTMAYFLQESRLFHVDMSTGKFMDGQYFMMDNPPADYHSSRFVRPWKLPQQLFSGIINLSNGPIRRAKDKAPPGGYPLEGLTRQTLIG